MKKWTEVRAKAVSAGRIDEKKVNEHKAEMLAEIRAHKLAEIRNTYGLRQEDIAKRLRISQPRVSSIERGDIDQSHVSTLRAYAKALGGELEVTIRLGGERITIA